ncbi:hypothetical protein P4482_08795 [Neobacillus thermocopriae]|uniref:hypothetical protein n=1 Tax=Neobacillus thermocopriae TaxID=1215031 RepID=UPI002E248DA4|nr:hypothetical protein [Neobacillus thermocopriae]
MKDALKLIYIPHIQTVPEAGVGTRCEFCRNRAKYKLFNYSQQRKHIKQVI